jgi:hypothetical protein
VKGRLIKRSLVSRRIADEKVGSRRWVIQRRLVAFPSQKPRKGGARRRQRREIAPIDISLKKKITRGDFIVEEPHVSD